jgi:hypothetical protein
MKFMVMWEVHPDKRLDVLKAWVGLGRKGRANVGRGVKLIGRWHNSAEYTGVAIMAANDIKDLYRYLARWNTVMDLTVSPVLDDEESARLGRAALTDMKG